MQTLSELEAAVRTRRELPTPDVRRALRKAAGASQADVAGVIGVTPEAVGHWEAGTRTPKGRNLTSYVEVLRAFRKAVAEEPSNGALVP
jgi:transcriptional regulator with XRE-family HTH domain